MRRRVALLMDAIDDDYQAGIVRGAASAAQHAGVELVCLAGGVLGGDKTDGRQLRNFLFELLEPRDFDGILVLGGTLGSEVGLEALREWTTRFGDLPKVCLGVELPNCHSVVVDGAPGMRDTLRHLIEIHHHRRIAFIRGPATSFEAEERYQVYREVLELHQIAEDPRLVLQGNWMRASGAAAIRELFDVRAMAVDAVSAVAAANDSMALGALEALRERGVSVPGDIAVTGFDDADMGRCAVPPLTTVAQPTEALGREGMQKLVALLEGKNEARSTHLATTIVGRRSCGCAKTSVLMHRRGAVRIGRSLELAVLERRSLIFAELSRSARGSLVGAGPRWEERLLSSLLAELQGSSEGAFLTTVDQLMAGIHRAGGELALASSVLGTLRRCVQDCASGDADALLRIDDVLDSARELVGEWIVRGESLRRLEGVSFLRELSRVTSTLFGAKRGAAQRQALEEGLRGLGVSALCLGVFTQPGEASATCACLAAYESSGRAQAETQFRSADFCAKGLFENERGALLVQPLLFDEEPLGLLTVALGEQQRSAYEPMREAFCLGIRGYRLRGS